MDFCTPNPKDIIHYIGEFKVLPINCKHGDVCKIKRNYYLYNGNEWVPLYITNTEEGEN